MVTAFVVDRRRQAPSSVGCDAGGPMAHRQAGGGSPQPVMKKYFFP